jgi:hypothetical protein
MTGKRKSWRWIPATALALLAAAGASAAPPPAEAVGADWIIEHLARPVPMRTGFLELRESRLLKKPLRLVGEYRRPAEGVLVREVREPYRETTTIRAGEATIERDGDSRTFSLDRVPQLAGMQAGFGSLLSGDAAQLREHYRLDADGPRTDWRLTLTPRDPGMAEQVEHIALHGRGAELRCIETTAAGHDQPQRTLLAGAARDAAAIEDREQLAALCRGDSAQ